MFAKSRLKKFLAKISFGRVTLEKREVLIFGNFPEGRKVDMSEVDCSADRVENEGMSPYHVTNKSVPHVWQFEYQNQLR